MHMVTQAANRTSLMISWSLFPLIPVEELFAIPLQGLSARPLRVSYYFLRRVRDESEDVLMRYDAAFMIEWEHFVATELTLEIENQRRIWTCSDDLSGFWLCLRVWMTSTWIARVVSCHVYRFVL